VIPGLPAPFLNENVTICFGWIPITSLFLRVGFVTTFEMDFKSIWEESSSAIGAGNEGNFIVLLEGIIVKLF